MTHVRVDLFVSNKKLWRRTEKKGIAKAREAEGDKGARKADNAEEKKKSRGKGGNDSKKRKRKKEGAGDKEDAKPAEKRRRIERRQ